jgi:hypothetical protein
MDLEVHNVNGRVLALEGEEAACVREEIEGLPDLGVGMARGLELQP